MSASYDSGGQSMSMSGVCAREKKLCSAPMRSILERLETYNEFQIIEWTDDLLMNAPAASWPVVDALIAFFSDGFPLDKAIAYAQLRKPFLINDLEAQYKLLDRRMVYKALVDAGIDAPRHAIVSRDGKGSEPEIIEEEDVIHINGVRFPKPFVEKPVSGEDHNVYIYFPKSRGGGCKKLFRKIGNKSSEYDPNLNTIRRDGSYIYEDFCETEGMQDVKVYTVGQEYAHAESRKAPFVDGVVQRDRRGKEVRLIVDLTEYEQTVAAQVVNTFKQTVCGFDLLRSTAGRSYVIDVNGWSFVKGNNHYYDNCARELRAIINNYFRSNTSGPLTIPDRRPANTSRPSSQSSDRASPVSEEKKKKVLRGVFAVFRHGDRTPKQKVKLKGVTNASIIGLLEQPPPKETRWKNDQDPEKLSVFLETLKTVLAELGDNPSANRGLELGIPNIGKLIYIKKVLAKEYESIKIQLKPREKKGRLEVLIVCKWGGALTHAGRFQAERVGKQFRHELLDQGDFDESVLEDVVRLHSNNERRVIHTAQHFGIGLFRDRNLPRDVILNNKDTKNLLGTIAPAKDQLDAEKEILYSVMTRDHDFSKDIPSPSRDSLTSASAGASPAGKSSATKSSTGGAGKATRARAESPPPPQVETVRGSEDDSKLSTSAPQTPSHLNSRWQQDHGAGNKRAGSAGQGSNNRGRRSSHEAGAGVDRVRHSSASSVTQVGFSAALTEALQGQTEEEDPYPYVLQLALARVGNPRASLEKLAQMTADMKRQVHEALKHYPSDFYMCGSESLKMMRERWDKLTSDIYDPEAGTYDTSKVSDIYDSIRYDAVHNHDFLTNMEALYACARDLSDCVVPQEYGISEQRKLEIGLTIARPLLHRTLEMIAEASQPDTGPYAGVPRAAFFFTSESHMNSLFNTLLYSGLGQMPTRDEFIELNYLSHIVFRVWEDTSKDPSDPARFQVFLSVSTGVTRDLEIVSSTDNTHTLPIMKETTIAGPWLANELTALHNL